MSAPNSSGRCSTGVQKQLSTTNSAPWAWASSASADISATSHSGFDGVSINSMRVFPVTASRQPSMSVSPTKVVLTPKRARYFWKSTLVVPKTPREQTT